jgi:hypothetical protein
MPIRILIAPTAVATLSIGAAFADGLMIDPSKIKPEFRQAAIKRAAEQMKLADCQKQAAAQKLLPRYRVKFLTTANINNHAPHAHGRAALAFSS